MAREGKIVSYENSPISVFIKAGLCVKHKLMVTIKPLQQQAHKSRLFNLIVKVFNVVVFFADPRG